MIIYDMIFYVSPPGIFLTQTHHRVPLIVPLIFICWFDILVTDFQILRACIAEAETIFGHFFFCLTEKKAISVSDLCSNEA